MLAMLCNVDWYHCHTVWVDNYKASETVVDELIVACGRGNGVVDFACASVVVSTEHGWT